MRVFSKIFIIYIFFLPPPSPERVQILVLQSDINSVIVE